VPLLQLTKLKGKLGHTPVSAGPKLLVESEAGTSDDVALLRQRVAELELMLHQSKTDASLAANGDETGLF